VCCFADIRVSSCHHQAEDLFNAASDTVIPAAQWPTAKDDLEIDLVQMLKDKAANVRTE